MHLVIEEAVSGWKRMVLASQDGPIRQNQASQQFEVVLSHLITHIHRSSRDGPRSGVEISTRVSGVPENVSQSGSMEFPIHRLL